jgi:hypothetical protein
VVPSADDYRYPVGYCSFCGSTDKPLPPADADAAGLLEPDGERWWRVRHGSVPGWATSQPLPPPDQEDGTTREDEG